jgi:signal transduction histidine kinase
MAAIGEIASGIAHEINNPVGFIGTNLSVLRDYLAGLLELTAAYEDLESQLDASGRERVRALKTRIDLAYVRDDAISLLDESGQGVRRVRDLVQDLRRFAHPDEEATSPANVHETIDRTLNLLHNEIKYKATVAKHPADLPDVECSEAQLGLSLVHVLMNAAAAVENGGVVTIRTGTDGASVWIEVDAGKGATDRVWLRAAG